MKINIRKIVKLIDFVIILIKRINMLIFKNYDLCLTHINQNLILLWTKYLSTLMTFLRV